MKTYDALLAQRREFKLRSGPILAVLVHSLHVSLTATAKTSFRLARRNVIFNAVAIWPVTGQGLQNTK